MNTRLGIGERKKINEVNLPSSTLSSLTSGLLFSANFS